MIMLTRSSESIFNPMTSYNILRQYKPHIICVNSTPPLHRNCTSPLFIFPDIMRPRYYASTSQVRKCLYENIFAKFFWKLGQTGKTTPIRLTSVGIMGDKLRSSLKSLGSSKHYRIVGFKGALNSASIMPRDDILSTADVFFSGPEA